jgi:tetratricopeptide (TPR) repeat protein
MDFASDEKATKQTARRMLEMARAVNGDLMAGLPVVDEGSKHQVVSCYTCHRGQAKPPRNIVVELGGIAESDGVDAALVYYDELRAEHFGAGVYDFSESALASAAGYLMQAGRAEDAVKALEKNLEHYPSSADSHAMIGMVHLQTGNAEDARPALERALEIDPENGMAQRAMQMLSAQPSEDAADR